MKRMYPILALCLCATTALAAPRDTTTRRSKKPVHARPAATTAPERATLPIETVPAIVVERAQRGTLSAAREEVLHQPPPLDAAPKVANTVTGQLIQITPTTVQVQDQATKTVKTFARGAATWENALVGDVLELTLSPASDSVTAWKKK